MVLVIKDCNIVGKKGNWDIKIKDGKIQEIGHCLDGDEYIDGNGKYVSPGFKNTHTHAAMTLFRGYAEDLPLDRWLQEKIWPLESELTEEDVYWGTKLACLEMIKSGTVAFNDMYFYMGSAAKAVEEMGLKATLGYGLIDLGDEDKLEEEKQTTLDFIEEVRDMANVTPSVSPHAVYTVSDEGLQWCAELSKKEGIPLHIHIAETEKEIKEQDGSVVEHLDDLDILYEKTVAAHCVWLDEHEIEILAERDLTVSHCPVSNMKLGVGKPMDYGTMKKKGVRVTLGTDGCASNNNLDMFEEVKIAAIQQKMSGDTTMMPAGDAYGMLIDDPLDTGCYAVNEGMSADLILIEGSVPNHDFVSDIVYSLSGCSVTDTVVEGKVLMKDGYVEGEENILEKASYRASRLISKVF